MAPKSVFTDILPFFCCKVFMNTLIMLFSFVFNSLLLAGHHISRTAYNVIFDFHPTDVQPWRLLKFQRGVMFAFSKIWTGDIRAWAFGQISMNPPRALSILKQSWPGIRSMYVINYSFGRWGESWPICWGEQSRLSYWAARCLLFDNGTTMHCPVAESSRSISNHWILKWKPILQSKNGSRVLAFILTSQDLLKQCNPFLLSRQHSVNCGP